MRSIGLGVVGLIAALTTLSLGACGDDDPAATGSPDGGTSPGASSSSSSTSSSGNTPGGDDDDDDTTDGGPPIDPNTPPSCRGSNGSKPGIDTCGADEPGNESCCKSLTLPTTKTRKLDRYEITAGRLRAFIEAVSKDNGGQPNIRKFAKDFAAKNPDSQLGTVAKDFPAQGQFQSYLDVLPEKNGTDAPSPLPVWLGAFPADAINNLDGCFVSAGGVGAATYWQDAETLKKYEIGYGNPPNGARKYDASVLDKKALNCVPPILLATFCAWDGGELARTSDYREVWGRNQVKLPGAQGATVFIPWTDVLKVGDFNWRNGHGAACPAGTRGWPGCGGADPPAFYAFPEGGNPLDDDSPAIGAPGRFEKDVTKAVSDDGGGWFDVGGNLMEAAWPNTKLVTNDKNFCETAAGNGQPGCTRTGGRQGTMRYQGDVPPIVLIGYSFEGHAQRGEKYLSNTTGNETDIAQGDIRAAHFQYGKVGGRCARLVAK